MAWNIFKVRSPLPAFLAGNDVTFRFHYDRAAFKVGDSDVDDANGIEAVHTCCFIESLGSWGQSPRRD